MLVTVSETAFLESHLRSAVFLERRFRGLVLWKRRLAWDSRFVVPIRRPAGVASIYLCLEGMVQLDAEPPQPGPWLGVLAEHELESRIPSARTLRAWGDPCIALDLRVREADVRGPIGLEAGARALPDVVLRAMARLAEDIITAQPDAAFVALLDALAAAGVVAPELSSAIVPEPPHLVRLWNTLRPLHEHHGIAFSQDELATAVGMSSRNLYREVTEFASTFGLAGDAFRDTMLNLRLRTAALLLSAPEATVGDVAKFVGYGSVDAIARAFRDAGLPPPSTLAAEARYPTT